MRILLDLNHPAQYYIFKKFIPEMKEKGHEIFTFARKKDILLEILDLENQNYIYSSDESHTILGNVGQVLKHERKMYKFVKENKIDIIMGTTLVGAHISRVSKAKSVILNEDDKAVVPQFTYMIYPFADHILTPDCLPENNGKKHVKYPSFHELAYLHPNNYTPDLQYLSDIGINEGDRFFILRFSALKATHDLNMKGIPLEVKKEIVRVLENHGDVYITSEVKESSYFKKYGLPVKKNKIHDLLSQSELYLGDSQSMSVESAILGVPSFRCNSFVDKDNISVIKELRDKYGLINDIRTDDSHQITSILKEFLGNSKLNQKWKQKKKTLLHDKVDFNKYLQNFLQEI